MFYHRFGKLAIVLVVIALIGLACSACGPTEDTPAPPPTEETPEEPLPPPTEETPEETAPPPTGETPEEPAPPPTAEPTEAEAAPTAPCPPVYCLRTCYASNIAPAGGNGTQDSQWRGTGSSTELFDRVECAAKARGMIPSSLIIMTCADRESPTCPAVEHVFDGQQWRANQLGSIPNPYVGVPLPSFYILASLALLGVLLIGAGIMLRQRVRRLSP